MTKKELCSLIFVFTLLASSPAGADPTLDNAKDLYLAGKFKDAAGIRKDITGENASNEKAWVLLGDCYVALKKEKRAIKAYKSAVEINPENTHALFSMGVIYSIRKEYAKAVIVLEKVVHIQPKHAEARFYLGLSYDSLSMISAAFEQYKSLKSLDQDLANKLYKVILGS